MSGVGREYVIGWISVRPGTRDEFLRRSSAFQEEWSSEEGVVFFELHPTTADPNLVIALECYADTETHKRHVAAPTFAAFLEMARAFIADARFENVVAQRRWLDRL